MEAGKKAGTCEMRLGCDLINRELKEEMGLWGLDGLGMLAPCI